MKSICISDDSHTWIMDHKDSKHKSANDVICYLIDNIEMCMNEKFGCALIRSMEVAPLVPWSRERYEQCFKEAQIGESDVE